MTTPTKLYTVRNFWKFIELPENVYKKFELINGVIVEKMSPKVRHSRHSSTIHGNLFQFLEEHPIGEVYIELDHYSPDDDFNTRRPEISYFSNERARLLDQDDYASLMPDLAIEVKSPSNTYKELREKAEYYLKHRSRMVWNFIPEKKEVHVYTLTDDSINVQVIGKTGTLEGGEVLPGFKLPLSKVFKE